MLISIKPYRATLSQNSDGETFLVFDCRALGSGVLEIDDRYVFTGKAIGNVFSKRRRCDLELWIKRRSSINEVVAAKLRLSKEKIGELTFCPPRKAGDFTPALYASLSASLFIGDQLFDTLMNLLLSGKRPTSIALDVEKEGVIKYGWEPDGSRMEWKTQNSDESIIDVISISFRSELFADGTAKVRGK